LLSALLSSVAAVTIYPGTEFIVGNTSYTVDHPIDFYQIVINESWIMFNDFKFTDTTSENVVITGITDDSISFTNDSGYYTIYKPRTIINVESKSVTVNQSFTLNISCYPAAPIKGWEFKVRFDESLLSALSVGEGNFFNGYDTFFVDGIINNVNGTIINIYDLIVGKGNVSQSGVFVILAFKALSAGNASIELYDVGVCNETKYLINTVNYGNVIINNEIEEPEPPVEPEPPIEPPPEEPPAEQPAKQPENKTYELAPSLGTVVAVIAACLIVLAAVWIMIVGR
jgi:hypothetical protein